ncbi:MAG: hypothetical protein ACI9HH_005843, partial [Pseudomonadota bacterium]
MFSPMLSDSYLVTSCLMQSRRHIPAVVLAKAR